MYTYLITGATSDIGLELIKTVAKNGDRFILRGFGGSEKIEVFCRENHIDFDYYSVDLSNPEDTERFVTRLDESGVIPTHFVHLPALRVVNTKFKNFDEDLGIFKPFYVILLINHKSKKNKFIMILSHKNLKDQFELYNDFEKYYARFKSLFDFLDSDIGLSIYYNGENDNKITHLSVLSDEDYPLYNLLITILSKMVLELDNSDHKLFNYQEDFSWTDLLSDYILSIEEK